MVVASVRLRRLVQINCLSLTKVNFSTWELINCHRHFGPEAFMSQSDTKKVSIDNICIRRNTNPLYPSYYQAPTYDCTYESSDKEPYRLMSPTRSHCKNSPSADWNARQDFQTLLMPYNSYMELREGLRTKLVLRLLNLTFQMLNLHICRRA